MVVLRLRINSIRGYLGLGLGLGLLTRLSAADERPAEEREAGLRPRGTVFDDRRAVGEESVEHFGRWRVGGEGGAEGVGAGAEAGGACGWWGRHWLSGVERGEEREERGRKRRWMLGLGGLDAGGGVVRVCVLVRGCPSEVLEYARRCVS